MGEGGDEMSSPECGQVTGQQQQQQQGSGESGEQGGSHSPATDVSSQLSDYASLLDELPDLSGLAPDDCQKHSQNDDPDYTPTNWNLNIFSISFV